MSKTTERVVLRLAGWGPLSAVTEEMVSAHARVHPDLVHGAFGLWLLRGSQGLTLVWLEGANANFMTYYPEYNECCPVSLRGHYVAIVVEREVEAPDEEPCPSETPPHIGHPWRQQIEFALSSMDSRLSDLERASKDIMGEIGDGLGPALDGAVSRLDVVERRAEKTADYVFVSLNPTVDGLVDSIKNLTYHLEAIRSRLAALEQTRTVQPWAPYAPTPHWFTGPHWVTGPVTCRHETGTGGKSDE